VSAAVAFAFGAGLLATVNPCGFVLLPSFLGLYLGAEDGETERVAWLSRAANGFFVGIALSVSFSAVFVFTGLLVSAGLRSVLSVVPWVAIAIGTGLAALGLAMLAGRHVGLASASRVAVRGGAGGYRRVAVFGVTYAIASLACTLGVFLAVVAQALAVGNVIQLLAVFAAYAAGSASLLLAISLSAALAKGGLARSVRKAASISNRATGALLAASGVYLVLYWLPSLGSGSSGFSNGWAARSTRRISADLASFFAAHTTGFAIGLAAVTVGGLIIGVAELSRRRRTDTSGPLTTSEEVLLVRGASRGRGRRPLKPLQNTNGKRRAAAWLFRRTPARAARALDVTTGFGDARLLAEVSSVSGSAAAKSASSEVPDPVIIPIGVARDAPDSTRDAG
jgi:cytochrome c-type biogenesis protein